MNDYILSCCSTVDVTQEKLDALGIRMICNRYTLNGEPYFDDLGKTMPYQVFYDRIRKGETGVTTLINTAAPFADRLKPVQYGSASLCSVPPVQ